MRLIKNRFAVSDSWEVIHPGGNHTVTLARMRAQGRYDIAIAPGSGHVVRIQLDVHFDRALLALFIAEYKRARGARRLA